MLANHVANLAFALLGVAACGHWWRHRDRAAAWLAVALGLLGATLVISPFQQSPTGGLPGAQQALLFSFMGSGYALVELRNALVPMPPRRRWAFRWLVAVPTLLTLVLALFGSTAVGRALLPINALFLVLVWAACVAEPTVALWRESSTRPHVQRARMRALSVGYAGLALAVVIAVSASLVQRTTRGGTELQLPLQLLALAAALPIYAGFAPPRWLRAAWRAREEQAYRGLTAVLMGAADEATMAARALDGAIRLLGAEGGVLVTPHGQFAGSGMTLEESETPGATGSIVVPLRGEGGEGRLVLRAGPLTPFFGSEEISRLRTYADDIVVALERSRDSERLHTLLRTVGHLGEGLVITEAGSLVYANQAYIDLTGYSEDELIGRQLLDLAPPAAQKELTDRLRNRIMGAEVTGHYESQLVRKDGAIIDVEAAVQLLSAEGPNRVLALVRDITARKKAEMALAAAALVDALTGVPNRRAWDDELPRAVGRARRAGAPLCVAMMDVDRFKEYNDDWGHQAGDRLLAEVARSWSEALREVDFLARFGGDEFAVVMPDCSATDATRVLERLEAATPQQRRSSIGVAEWDDNETVEELVGRADAALMEAKRSHRGRSAWPSPGPMSTSSGGHPRSAGCSPPRTCAPPTSPSARSRTCRRWATRPSPVRRTTPARASSPSSPQRSGWASSATSTGWLARSRSRARLTSTRAPCCS